MFRRFTAVAILTLALFLSACGVQEQAPAVAKSAETDLRILESLPQSTSFTLNSPFDGDSVCGTPYLSIDPNAAFSFTDPVPAGKKVVQVVLNIYGTGCYPGDDTLTATLNGAVLGSTISPAATRTCAPNGCDPVRIITSSTIPAGISGYVYGGSNTLVISSNDFFIAYVQVTLVYGTCGNGTLNDGETCDDGNTIPNDGCSAICQIESGYACPVANMPCVDINECTNGTATCSANASCINTLGSYTCTCKVGYEGNGATCTACASGTYNNIEGGTCKACADGYYATQSGSTSCTPCAEGHTSYTSHIGCYACPSGYFAQGTGNSTCTACAAGFYAPNSGSASCLPCAKGYANNQTGQNQCQACGVGFFAAAEGSAACEACPKGSYTASLGSAVCTPCAKGYAQNQIGQAACQACAPGFFAAVEGSAACEACPKGSYSVGERNTSCSLCPEGTVNNAEGRSTCQECAAGFESKGAGAFTCSACEPGYYAATSGTGYCSPCAKGYANNAYAQKACQACAAGFYAAQAGSLACEACGRGTYSSGLGNANCSVCPGGTANNQLGQASCQTCPAGTETRFAGAEVCDPCPAGEFASEPGTTTCTPCAKGYVTNLTGQTTCQPCATGFFANAEGSLACEACPAGAYADTTGSAVCKLCRKGEANNAIGRAYCQACSPGYFTNYEGATACEACGKGEHASGSANSSCEACPEGTANNQFGQGECVKCEAGYESRGKGAFACGACVGGTYAPTSGTNLCLKCPEGTATNLTGQTSCAPCEMGFYAASIGQTSCQPCPVGSYGNQTGLQSCPACPVDTYTDLIGQATCTACESGFGSGGGAAFCSAVCGDGAVVSGEVCDDGNTESNDGCRGDCQKIEDGWDCPQAGEPCKQYCTIEQVNHYAGDANPANPCQICNPAISRQAWSNAARGSACSEDELSCTQDACDGFGTCAHSLITGCLIDGACVAEGAVKADAPCLACRSALVATAYSAEPYGVPCTDDGQTDTLDICNGAGVCSHIPANACQIDGQTVAAGSANPQNPCQWCDPSSSTSAYSPRAKGFACTSDELPCTADVCDGQGSCAHPLTGGCLIDGQCIEKGAPSPQSDCQICDPDHGTGAYYSVAAGTPCADDELPGTSDLCDGQGVCKHEAQGSCTIDGITYQGGASNPQNSCQYCDAQQSATSWSTRLLNFPCADDGLACTFDACDATGQCLHRLSGGCLIASACVAEGAQDPSNDCAVCDFETNPNGYSPKVAGERCADDGLSYTNDLCNSQGVCTHEKNGGCEIEGVSYASGAVNPQNICQACNADSDPTKWTNRAANVACTDDANACTNDVCDGAGTCQHTPITDGACADGDVDTVDGDTDNPADGDTTESEDGDTDGDTDATPDGDTDATVDGDTDTAVDGDADSDTIVPPTSDGGGGCQSANGFAPALLMLIVGLALTRRRKA